MNGGNVVFNFKGDDTDLKKTSSNLASSMGKVAGVIGKSFAVAGTALTAVVIAGVKGYADLEQSVGGVETLFKGSADAVINNAENAYKTAGISANQYMEQVTSISASLLQSLGGDTAESAKTADMAIIDMADNANKMGTSMEAIQYAYQGFAKQNYTMLDNLKLGYGGTKTEMERLLADASKLSGQKYEMGNLNDMYNAIHVIQGEMGITGTTAKEASSTITGSMASAKSAFTNFISGAGGIEEVISTFITAGTNIGNAVIKMAPQIADGLVQLLNALIPQIAPMLQALLPSIIKGAGELLLGLVKAIPSIVKILIDMLPFIIQMLSEMLPQILKAMIEGVILIITALAEQTPVLIPQIIEAILSIIPLLIDNLPLFIEAGFKLIVGIILGLIQAIPELLKYIPKIIKSIMDFFADVPNQMGKIGKNLIVGLWNGISGVVNWLYDKIKGFVTGALNKIKSFFGIHSPSTEFAFIGKMNVKGLVDGMQGMEKEVQQSFDGMFDLSPQLYGTASQNLSPNITVINQNNFKQDALGQMVNDIKTYSGGAKNSYNYGGGVS